MAKPYAVRFLQPDKIQQAYPLLQMTADLSLERWRAYAEARLIEPGRDVQNSIGIVSIENNEGYILGLFGYRVDFDLNCGRVLICENLVALDLMRTASVLQVLVESIESLAEQLKCDAVHVRIPKAEEANAKTGNGVLGALQGAGHTVQGLELCRPLSRTRRSG